MPVNLATLDYVIMDIPPKLGQVHLIRKWVYRTDYVKGPSPVCILLKAWHITGLDFFSGIYTEVGKERGIDGLFCALYNCYFPLS